MDNREGHGGLTGRLIVRGFACTYKPWLDEENSIILEGTKNASVHFKSLLQILEEAT